MTEETGSFSEWLWPTAFMIAMGWVIWHMPVFILDFAPHANESMFAQVSAIHISKDVTPNMAGLFGGFADPIDWLALVLVPIFAFMGVRTSRVAAMEFQEWRRIDRFSIFIGRVTMILILTMTTVMLYEVFVRYVIEAPTKWANELTLWIAGFVFLLSGLYAMQQRCHIRIFIIYDMLPRNVQRFCDVLWTFMVMVFAIGLVYGSYKQVFIRKFYNWEMMGTAFDPPIPAIIQPTILIMIILISLQAISNLICDWNAEPKVHTAADDVDEEELAAIKRAIGEE